MEDSISEINGNLVTLKSEVVIEPDFILSAVGRVSVAQDAQTVDLIGDASSQIQLAHYAIQQGVNFVSFFQKLRRKKAELRQILCSGIARKLQKETSLHEKKPFSFARHHGAAGGIVRL